MHFLPFNPVDKRTAITYIDNNGNWHRSSKGAPEQVRQWIICLDSYNIRITLKYLFLEKEKILHAYYHLKIFDY